MTTLKFIIILLKTNLVQMRVIPCVNHNPTLSHDQMISFRMMKWSECIDKLYLLDTSDFHSLLGLKLLVTNLF